MERARQMGVDTVVNPFEDRALEQLMELGAMPHWIVGGRSRRIACVLIQLVEVDRSLLSDSAEKKHHFELVWISLLKS